MTQMWPTFVMMALNFFQAGSLAWNGQHYAALTFLAYGLSCIGLIGMAAR